MSLIRNTLVACAFVAAAGAAKADTAIQSFTGGTLFGFFTGAETVGWVFDAVDNLVVTDLGWYSTDGSIEASHRVGIWTSGGDLLGAATVTAGAPDASGFRYVSIFPIKLFAGERYHIGGQDTSTDGDRYITAVSDLVVSSSLTYVGSAVADPGVGLAFPGLVNVTTTSGRFGPNFKFNAFPAAIPEPATWALMIGGFGMAGATLRRARRRASIAPAV